MTDHQRALAQHDLREASVRLEQAEERADGRAIALYTTEVDRLATLVAELPAPTD